MHLEQAVAVGPEWEDGVIEWNKAYYKWYKES